MDARVTGKAGMLGNPALTTNPNYVLATAQLPEGDEALNCTYNYKVTPTVKNSSYSSYYASDIYMNEMNIDGTAGDASTPSAKIGLMYVSNFALSLGDASLKSYSNGWLSSTNSGDNDVEWTMTRFGTVNNYYASWATFSNLTYGLTGEPTGYRPAFYLTNDVKITADGDGSLNNPYMIVE